MTEMATVKRKLLKPGWAGELSNSEMEYIQQKLKKSPLLRRKWGYEEAILNDVPVPAPTIRRIARHGVW